MKDLGPWTALKGEGTGLDGSCEGGTEDGVRLEKGRRQGGSGGGSHDVL